MTTGPSVPAVFPRSHIPALDGLRGWAILLVLFAHLASPFRWSGLPLTASRFGWVGVDLFFVLSGFLITGILLDSKSGSGYLKNFYARRILRIWPIYFLLLAVVFLITPHWGAAFQFPHSVYRWQYYIFYLQNLWLSDYGPPAFRITWSLAVEEQFYLVWPLLVLITSQHRLKQILIALAIAAPLLRIGVVLGGGSDFTLYAHTFCRLDGLIFGSLLALWTRSQTFSWERLRRFGKLGLAFGAPATVLAFYFSAGYLPPASRIGFSIALWFLAITFVSCLALTLFGSQYPARVTRLLADNAVLRRIGKISYGLYIYHYLLFLMFQDSRWYRAMVLWQHNVLAEVVAAMVELLIAYTVAEISWRFIETPILKLKRHFETRVEPAASSPLAAVATQSATAG
jgi:peptidoglycan/LPS O-acetylase OafA/YrhL